MSHSTIPGGLGLPSSFHWPADAEPDPDMVAQIARQAAVHASRSEYRQAMACYGRALLLDDSRAPLWFNYASVQRAAGMLRDAAESFEFAISLDPRLYAARYCLANLLVELGQPLAAIEHLRVVTREHPEYMPAWRNLGKLECAIGAVRAGQESLVQALRRAPHDPEILSLLQELEQEAGEEAGPPQN